MSLEIGDAPQSLKDTYGLIADYNRQFGYYVDWEKINADRIRRAADAFDRSHEYQVKVIEEKEIDHLRNVVSKLMGDLSTKTFEADESEKKYNQAATVIAGLMELRKPWWRKVLG